MLSCGRTVVILLFMLLFALYFFCVYILDDTDSNVYTNSKQIIKLKEEPQNNYIKDLIISIPATKKDKGNTASKSTIVETRNNYTDMLTSNPTTKIFKNVCIEGDGVGKRIVMYNSDFNGYRVLTAKRGRTEQKWRVYFTTEAMPGNYEIVDAHAYFVHYSYYGNLHHLWSDTFCGTYGSMKAAGDYVNYTFVPKEIHFLASRFVRGRRKRRTFLDTEKKKLSDGFLKPLGVTFNDVYTNVPDKTCYKKAVMGYDYSSSTARELEEITRLKINISDSVCKSDQLQIILQVRHQRKILNADEIHDTLENELPVSVQNVYFEDIPVAQQIQLVNCADLLIGIMGAGLEYYRFMKPGAGLIEIGWEGFSVDMYSAGALSRKLVTCRLQDTLPSVSDRAWQNYRKINPQYAEKSKSDIIEISKTVHPKGLRTNIWKYADCTVNAVSLVNAVQSFIDKQHRK